MTKFYDKLKHKPKNLNLNDQCLILSKLFVLFKIDKLYPIYICSENNLNRVRQKEANNQY